MTSQGDRKRHINIVIDKSRRNMYIGKHRFTANIYLKVNSPPFFIFFSILDFKTLFLRLEVGIRLKVLHYENNTICCVVEIRQRWNLNLHYYCVEVSLLICLWFRNSTKHNSAKSSTYVNHGEDET